MRRIGEILVSQGLLSAAALSRALELQSRGGGSRARLGGLLLKWDLLSEKDLLEALAKVHRCPAVDWAALSSAKREVTHLLSPAQATRLGALPYASENKTVRVAFLDPSNLAAVDEVSAITGRRVVAAVTPEVRLMQAHQRFYSRPLSREIWSIVQKLDLRRARAAESAASGSVSVGSGQPAAPPRDAMPAPSPPDLSEIADSLLPMIDDSWDRTIPVSGLADRTDPASGEAEPDELPDPLTDDSPLSKFVADVLAYFAARSDLDAVLESISEPESVEDLTSSAEPDADEPPPDLDSTLPSGSHRRGGSSRRPN